MWKLYLREARRGFGGFRPKDRKVLVVGIPMDYTSSYRSGARFAPEAIRRVSESIELCSVLGDCIVEELGIDDIGDLQPIAGDVISTLRMIEELARDLVGAGKRVIAIGGDHTISIGLVKGLSSVVKGACLCVVDAHLDLRDELFGRYSHATTMRRILEECRIDRIVWVGVRAFSSEELEYLKELEIPWRIVKSFDVLSDPQSISSVVKFLNDCEALYLSIDVDGFDPSYAPGVQTPEPMGIPPYALIKMLEEIEVPILAADIVEISPPYDVSESTVALGARLIVELARHMYRR